MNKNTAKDYLPLVQALAEGMVIQEKVWTDVGKWEWRDSVEFDLFRYPPSDYRIKPEPKEFFMNRYPDGTEDGPFDTVYSASTNLRLNGGVVCYREVIE